MHSGQSNICVYLIVGGQSQTQLLLVKETNLHMCIHPPGSGCSLCPPESAVAPPAVYWAGCSLHRPSVEHHSIQLFMTD